MDRSLYYKIILVVAAGTVILFALVTLAGLSKDSAPQGNFQAGYVADAGVVKLAPSPTSSSAVGSPRTRTQLPFPQPSMPPAASPALQAPAAAAQPQQVLPMLQLKAGWKWEQYHSYDELMDFMLWMAAAANHSCRTYSIGKSVQGREMRVVELGGTLPDVQRRQLQGEAAFRPVVKLLAGQHGDETASMELMLRFAWYLAASYGRDARVTALLSATSVHILPVINPDGLVERSRNNANNADLNRNFPLTKFPYARPGPEGVGDSAAVQHWRMAGNKAVQPENAAIMAWSRSTPSVLSANAHGGALVANYPFDACDTEGLQSKCPTPEDPLPQFLAQVYAANHPEMRTNNREGFTNGTTSGARWYPVIGSMQDWLYHNSRTLDLTFELHDHKMPSLAYLATMWPHNLPSLMRYCEMAHVGVLGRVVDAADPSKHLEAGVEVLRPAGGRAVATDPAWGGAFFKLLAPNRSYCLGVTPQGYQRVLLAVRVPQEAGAVIGGKGLEGLTVEVRVEAWPTGSAAAREVVVVGGAAPDVCKDV